MGIDIVRSKALNRVLREISQRRVGSRRAALFHRCVEHVRRHPGHQRRVARPCASESPWLGRMDAVAALGVAGVIIWIGSRLGKRTADALLDVAPQGLRERIETAVGKTEGVLAIRTRARAPRGPALFRGRDASAFRAPRASNKPMPSSEAVEKEIERDRAGGRGGARRAARRQER